MREKSMGRTAAAFFALFFFGIAGVAGPTWADDIPPLGFKKTLEDESDRAPNTTPAAEAFLLRAYPETDIPSDASFAAVTGWATLRAGARSTGSWQLIGP